MNYNFERVAKNLQFLRAKKGLNRVEFAKVFEINYGAYTRYENGTASVPGDVLIKLSNFYKLPVDAILKHDLFDQPIHTDYQQKEENQSTIVNEPDGTIDFLKNQVKDILIKLDEYGKKKMILNDMNISASVT